MEFDNFFFDDDEEDDEDEEAVEQLFHLRQVPP